MAKGTDLVEQQAAATAAARQRMQESFLPELRVNDKNPGPYTVRFCEQGQDVNSFPVHEYKEPHAGGVYHRRFTCFSEIQQECEGCKARMKRKVRGVYNLIQRGRPVFRKDHEGKAMKDAAGNYIIDGYADQVVVLNVGGPAAEYLRQMDGQYQGLMARDFVITYSGNTFQAINLTPAMDAAGNSMPTPMSEADIRLWQAKHDLDAYMKPPTHQEAAQIVAQFGANSGAAQQPQSAPVDPTSGNTFLQGANLPPGGAFGALANTGAPATPPPPQAPAPTYQPPPAQAPPVQQQPPQQPAPPQQPQPPQTTQYA